MSALATAAPAAIDLRMITPRDRHALVVSRLDALQTGQCLLLLSDHNPQPLQVELDSRASGHFDWATLQAGPGLWRVQITRVGLRSAQLAADSCCSGGTCCG